MMIIWLMILFWCRRIGSFRLKILCNSNWMIRLKIFFNTNKMIRMIGFILLFSSEGIG